MYIIHQTKSQPVAKTHQGIHELDDQSLAQSWLDHFADQVLNPVLSSIPVAKKELTVGTSSWFIITAAQRTGVKDVALRL